MTIPGVEKTNAYYLLTRRRPLIEFNRVSVRIFHEVGSVDDVGRRIARRCHSLGHLAAVRNDERYTAELGCSQFDFAFANDDQRVGAGVSGHAKKILDGLTLCGNLGAHFQAEHFRVELFRALQIADSNSETRDPNRFYVVRQGRCLSQRRRCEKGG